MLRGIGVIGLAVILLCSALPVSAQDNGTFFVITGKTGERHLTLPGAAFMPLDPSESYEKYLGGGSASYQGAILNPTGGGGLWLTAPVCLPDGASVTQVTSFSCGSGGFLSVFLYRKSLLDANAEHQLLALIWANIPDCAENTDAVIENPVIDNLHYAYYLGVNMSVPGIALRAVCITYTGT